MENTHKNLFQGDNNPEWYIAMGETYVGPMSASDLYARIQKAELSFMHYAWKQGMTEWKRICDIQTFQISAPPPPPKKPDLNGPPVPPRKAQKKEWFLFASETQYGPFTEDEVKAKLQMGSLDVNDTYAWKEGMTDWEQLSQVSALKVTTSSAPVAPTQNQKVMPPVRSADADKRTAPRRPMLSQIIMANNSQVIMGVCRDVSIGGMQVLCEEIPGGVGTKIKLNVSPVKGSNDFPAFIAEGTIVRILEDHRGFSFRFANLNAEAKAVLEQYVANH